MSKRISRTKRLLTTYGITNADYDLLKASQLNVCAICNQPETKEYRPRKGQFNRMKPIFNRLSVDHCHETGRVRGLLCSRCNIAIGQFEDNPALLLAAAKYLQDSMKGHSVLVRAKVAAGWITLPPS